MRQPMESPAAFILGSTWTARMETAFREALPSWWAVRACFRQAALLGFGIACHEGFDG